MKNKLIAIVLLVAIIFVGGYTVYSLGNNIKLSDLALANVEALASYEGDFDIVCNGTKNTPPGRCWVRYGECQEGWFIRFDDCRFSGSVSNTCLTPCD